MRPTHLPLLEGSFGGLRARRWRLLAGALLGAVLATGLFFATPQRYVSTSSVALTQPISYLTTAVSEKKSTFVTLDTTAFLVRSDAVVGSVAAAMGVGIDEARAGTTVSAQPLSTVLRIHVSGPTRAQARAGSRAASDALLREQARLFHLDAPQVRLLRKQVAILRAAVLKRTTEGEDVTGPANDLRLLEERLQDAITTNRPGSLVLRRHDVAVQRPGQLEVFTTGGLVAGALLAALTGPWGAGRRRPSDITEPHMTRKKPIR